MGNQENLPNRDSTQNKDADLPQDLHGKRSRGAHEPLQLGKESRRVVL